MTFHYSFRLFLSTLLGASLLFLIAPTPSYAQGACPASCRWGCFERPLPGLPGSPPYCIDTLVAGGAPLTTYAGLLINFITALIVAVGLILVAVGGYFYMTAGGSADRVQLGKSFIVAALSGIVLALTAWILLTTLNPQFTNFVEPVIPP